VAHDIATTNGRPAIAFYGDVPWRGLGTKLDHPATAAEVITTAGLDYEVELTPLYTGKGIGITNRRAVVQSNTSQVLGVVSHCYVCIQNAQCFQFLDAVGAEPSRITVLCHEQSPLRAQKYPSLVTKNTLART
jgi:hypothetical protein